MKNSETRTPPKRIKSIRQLAELVGRNPSQVCRWIADPRWKFGRPPWPRSKLPAILRWVASVLKQSSVVAEASDTPAAADLRMQKLDMEIRKLELQARLMETDVRVSRGELLHAAMIETRWGRIGSDLRSGFESVPQLLTSKALIHGLPHDNAPLFNAAITEALASMLWTLSQDKEPVTPELVIQNDVPASSNESETGNS